MSQTTFVTLAVPGDVALQALLLAASIREFGGSVAAEPIWAMVPDGGPRITRSIAQRFDALDVRLVPFAADPEVRVIPFGVKAAAAAHAEAIVRTGQFVWLDPDAVMIGDGSGLLLPESAAVGYRPVHHKLVGIGARDPVDSFWKAVLRLQGVPETALFAMVTNAGEPIRAYLNAGVFSIKPDRRLARQWLASLVPSARHTDVLDAVQRDRRYDVFLHQAVWTAVVLGGAARNELIEIADSINYPLNLHDELPADRIAYSLTGLSLLRTEDLLVGEVDWDGPLRLMAPLRSWLEAQPLLAS